MNWKDKKVLPLLLVTALFMAGTLITACGRGGGGSSGSDSVSGKVVVSLTDAEGDFEKYEVDILSIRLTRMNGIEVEAMPETSRIDFAQYVDLEEIVSTAAVPLGAYKSAKMVLDYTNADIQLEVGGVSTPAVAQDRDGNSLGTIEVTVEVDSNRPLVIAPGLLTHLALDFDLETSNSVDTTQDPPLVTVDPVLIAEINPDFDPMKKHRIRGPLISINEAEETFQVGIRPFRLHLNRNRRDFGRFKVLTTADTIYEVDGRTGMGSEGFILLAGKPLLTPVIVIGELNARQHIFTAHEVLAGESVPGGGRDALRGSVIARSGDVLTVRGATLLRGADAILYRGDVTVRIGEETKVTKQGEHHHAGNPLNKDDISIGQRIIVFGAVSGLPDAIEIDATAGLVRMRYTTIDGTVNVIGSERSELELTLQNINGRTIGSYDFSGTGSNPAAYIVTTETIPLEEVSAGDPIRLRGHVAGFGASPPDFHASVIRNVGGVNALMAIHWHPATSTPFLRSSVSGLELDLSGVGRLHHVFRAHISAELMPEPAPLVLPKAYGRGRYAIRQAYRTTVYGDFGHFVQDLTNRLERDATLDRLYARGRYGGSTQTMSARWITVGLR